MKSLGRSFSKTSNATLADSNFHSMVFRSRSMYAFVIIHSVMTIRVTAFRNKDGRRCRKSFRS
jgi:hypothetical protein